MQAHAYGDGVEARWVRLKLDVETFDDGAFAHVVRQCESEGVSFKTMTELGDTESNRRRLYELNRTCAADIPERGEFFTYEEYVERRILRDYTPDTTVIALVGHDWVGMSAASDRSPQGYFFNEMTGVVRSHRGRGIALAMKSIVIQLVRDRGVAELRTFHHPDNAAPIALNRRLGYVDL
jgi:GNAT superfamily N-acetyltransferase